MTEATPDDADDEAWVDDFIKDPDVARFSGYADAPLEEQALMREAVARFKEVNRVRECLWDFHRRFGHIPPQRMQPKTLRAIIAAEDSYEAVRASLAETLTRLQEKGYLDHRLVQPDLPLVDPHA